MSISNTDRNELEVDLINILQLDIVDEDTADKILLDLINNGRQSLVHHRDDILEDIYVNVMTDNSQLLILLKNSVCNHWSSKLFTSYSWVCSFIEDYKTKSIDLYDQIITRTAEYGRKHFLNSTHNGEQVLFVVIQFVFNLNNERMMDGYTFNRIWSLLISIGLQGLKQLDDSIQFKDIKDNKILFQALREYFRPELFSILSKCKIIDCRGLYDFILDNIAEYGWRLGLEHIQKKITPRMFKELTNHVEILAPLPTLETTTTDEIKNKFLVINEKLLDMKTWTQIGEFNSLSLMLKSIIDRYSQHKTVTLFIHDCFVPIIYLLKREENLENFTELLKRLCHRSSIDYPYVYLRTIIHVLLSNSDESLRRLIITQLNKQNIIPFLQPGYLIPNSDIFYVWDYTRPCLLSFGIGLCQGKSSLLNKLFYTKFEIHNKENIYFQQTIDIDFGLNFFPERQFNIADTHGFIRKECLTKFQKIFDGYLIHIDENFLKQYPTVLNEYLSILDSNKFRLIFVHNSKIKNKISSTKQSIVLPNLIHINYHLKQFLTEDMRDDINKRLKDIIINQDNKQIAIQELSEDYYSIKKVINKYLTKISIDKKPWENEIEFPYYVKFVNICQQNQRKRKQAFIEVKENIGEILQVFDDSNSTSGKMEHESITLGVAFELFLEILQMQTTRRLLIIDYLSTKLINHDVSIEILWRNIMICYDQSLSPYLQTCLLNAYLDSIKAGYAFEIIDGDNFYLPHRFLSKTFTAFNENTQQRLLIISILGPRQTGKSTLLQYMFGIRINKRSTKGLYGTFVKSNVDAFDYILVLDTEGLDQGDDEYDRRLTLFCMSVSHIIILNVSNDIPDRFLDMLAICNDSLKRLVGNHCLSSIVHLVINQIPLFNHSINSNKILDQFQQHSVLNGTMNLTQDAIHCLPLAYRKDFSSSRIYTESIFTECTQELSMKILRSSLKLTPTILSKWLNTAILFFDVLQETPTVSCFQNLTERYHDDSILEYIHRRLFESLTPDHRLQILGYVIDKSSEEIHQIFNTNILASQESLQNQIDTRLDMIKATKTIRERSKHFLQRKVNEIFDGWRHEAIVEANNRRFSFEQKDSQKNKSNAKERGKKQ